MSDVSESGERTFLVPDLDGEIVADTGPVEELLLSLANGADDEPALPLALHDAGADAVGRLRVAIIDAPRARLFAPDGHYEHEPLAVVTVDATLHDRASAAITELVTAVQCGARTDVAEFVDDWAVERGTTAEALAAVAVRFLRLCEMAWGPEHEVLAPALARGCSSLQPAVLTDAEEGAYRLLRDRFVYLWHDGSPIVRWQY